MARYRLLLVNLILAGTLFGSYWGRRIEAATVAQPDFLRQLFLPFRGWKTKDEAIQPSDLALLEPDSTLLRDYQGPGEQAVSLAVIAGHRKRSVHTPGACMPGDGWEFTSERGMDLSVPGHTIPAVRALMTKDRQEMLVTYFFTDGQYSTGSVLRFQGVQLLKRFGSRLPLGAMVRIIVPVTSTERAAERLADDFARATVPQVLGSIRSARLAPG